MTREISTPKAALDREYQYGQRWDFTKLPKRQSATAVVTAGANANDDVTAFPFFLTGARPILVVDAFCVASANSTALAAGDLSTWTITTLGGTSVAALARASDFVADTDVNMGAITSGYVAASDGLKLGIVNGTNADLNSAVCAVTVGYYDALDIMDGLAVVATNGGGVTVSDGVQGGLAITASDASVADNDETYVFGAVELYKFAAGKTVEAECRLKWTEANTDDANVFVGFMNAWAADALVDNGAGPKATGDYIGVWKVDGGLQWYAGAQANGTAVPTVDAVISPNANGGGGTFQTIRLKWVGLTSAIGQLTVQIDGVNVADIQHAYASATEMAFGIGLKLGGANAETVTVQKMWADQVI